MTVNNKTAIQKIVVGVGLFKSCSPCGSNCQINNFLVPSGKIKNLINQELPPELEEEPVALPPIPKPFGKSDSQIMMLDFYFTKKICAARF